MSVLESDSPSIVSTQTSRSSSPYTGAFYAKIDAQLRAPGDNTDTRRAKVQTAIAAAIIALLTTVGTIASGGSLAENAPIQLVMLPVVMAVSIIALVAFVLGAARSRAMAAVGPHAVILIIATISSVFHVALGGIYGRTSFICGLFAVPPVALLLLNSRAAARWYFRGTLVLMFLLLLITESSAVVDPDGNSALAATWRKQTATSDASGRTLSGTVGEFGPLAFFLTLVYVTVASRESIAEEVREDRAFVKLRAKEAEREAQREREANAAKTRFISVISHELRNPLTGIVLNAELLTSTSLREDQQAFVHGIVQSGEIVLALVNDVLDLSKIQAGSLILEYQNTDLLRIVESVLAATTHKAFTKNIDLVLDMQPDVSTNVRGDATRMRQVLFNLVTNALKFTQEGSVVVTLERREVLEDKWQERWAFIVTDTGIGIPEEAMDRLFAEFAQVDESTTRQYGGTGLGLYICRELTELMGGTVSCRSRGLGHGSTFTAEFLVEMGQDERTVQRQPIKVPSNADVRILSGTSCAALSSSIASMAQYALQWSALATAERHVSCPTITSLLESLATALSERHAKTIIAVFVDSSFLESEPLCAALVAARDTATTFVFPLAYASANVDVSRWDALATKPLTWSVLSRSLSLATSAAAVDEAPTLEVSSSKIGRSNHGSIIPSKKRQLLLVVDDNDLVRGLVATVLESFGFDTMQAEDGVVAQSAYESAGSGAFAAVFLDQEMPRQGGLETARKIRAKEKSAKWRHTPLISMTANAMLEDRNAASDAGHDKFLAKPVSRSGLLDILTELQLIETEGGATKGMSKAASSRRRKKKPAK